MLKKIMVPPYDEKENEGLARWCWQVQKCSTNSCSLCKNLAKHTSAAILRLRHCHRNYWSYLSSFALPGWPCFKSAVLVLLYVLDGQVATASSFPSYLLARY